ncbi:MAG: tetraacyldisaccharide 4'-kinase [Gemmatimonadetes bacterium]|nr:tetraacyldisaccharide 4'-kinase [Gemmatimonadota bacterium]
MRRALERGVRRWWAGEMGAAGAVLSAVTAPLEWVYAAEVRRRDLRYRSRPGARVEGLAVVSVGNLAVGGTGKTPMAAWAVRLLAEAGAHPVLLSRGYGEDEILLHRRWSPDVPVHGGADRLAAAQTAREQGADVAVLDDGFQHRRMARDVDVVLLAAEDAFPGRMLPRGPYREPPGALARAHAVVVTRRTAPATVAAGLAREILRRHPALAVAVLSLPPGGWSTLAGEPADAPQGAVLAAAGVARPETFRRQVAEATGYGVSDVELMAFPDHHGFTPADIRALRRRAGTRTLVVTEKDAVKLEAHASTLGSVRVLGVRLEWEAGEGEVRTLVAALAPREA